MPKTKSIFICSHCGHESFKWIGKCPDCGRWNSFEETQIAADSKKTAEAVSTIQPVALNEIRAETHRRLQTGIGELDRVLGGGVYPSSVVLIAGDPGIGKSTMVLQMLGRLHQQNVPVLYVSGEESLQQIRSRAQRLGLAESTVLLLAETELENILFQIEKLQPEVVVIDSIQSLYSENISGAPGNIGQVRECTAKLFKAAKTHDWSLFIVGHITKEGSIAGPKILEHTVDVVVYFEGDSLYQYRILRSLKNRFGATNEIGLFMMQNNGLAEVDNPSSLFLSGNESPQTGMAVVCSFEGTRPILAEIQALVSRSNYGVPQRTVSGFDQRRLSLLLAILEKHCKLNFGVSDVFVKISGGLRIDDPGIDFGIAAAIFSSFHDKPLPPKSVFIGEIGLNGGVRPVSQLDRRIDESIKLGFENIYLAKQDGKKGAIRRKPLVKFFLIRHISEIVNDRII